jgi:peptidoglycan/LPS O-acetylase OafA/YrhL
MKKAELISYSKGIAILGIILFHLISGYYKDAAIIAKAASFGGAGVHVFILCSGCGLMYSNLNKPLSFIDFIQKRFWKVYIPYIIVVLVAFMLPNVYLGPNNRFLALLSHIFLFKMFVPDYTATFGYHFWYISTIIQFYFVFTLLVKLLYKIGRKYFLFLSCFLSLLWAITISVMGLSGIRVWNSFFLQYLWEFSIGMLLACEYNESDSINIEHLPTAKLICITFFAFCIYFVLSINGGFFKVFNDPFSLASFGGICLLLYRCNFLPKFIYFTSHISYEIYLTHVLVYKLIFDIFVFPIPKYLKSVVALILVFLVSWLYNLFSKKILFNKKIAAK